MARFLGKERALFVFEEEMRQLRKNLKELNLDTPSFEKMWDTLSNSVEV